MTSLAVLDILKSCGGADGKGSHNVHEIKGSPYQKYLKLCHVVCCYTFGRPWTVMVELVYTDSTG